MAAIDEKLRLSIVTALDNAGIKATEDQINGLAKSIQKVNKEAGESKLENALGDLHGPLGKVGKALDGIPGKVFSIVGAFQTGYEVGTKFFDTVVRGWFGWEDAITKLKKANRALQKELAGNATAFDLATQKALAGNDAQIAKIDSAIAKINQQALAYTRLSKARSDFDNAGEDQEMQRLERERFEDIMALQASGQYDAAEQATKVYDILKQELQAKREIANYDEETARLEAQRAAKEQEAFKWLEKIDKLTDQKKETEARLQELDESDKFASKDYDRLARPLTSRIAAIDKQLDAANAQAEKYMADIDEGDLQSLTRERNRSTLADRLNLDRDKLLWDYGRGIDQNGDALGYKFDKDYIKQSYESSMKSYTELQSIKDNTAQLAEKLDALLQMKGG